MHKVNPLLFSHAFVINFCHPYHRHQLSHFLALLLLISPLLTINQLSTLLCSILMSFVPFYNFSERSCTMLPFIERSLWSPPFRPLFVNKSNSFIRINCFCCIQRTLNFSINLSFFSIFSLHSLWCHALSFLSFPFVLHISFSSSILLFCYFDIHHITPASEFQFAKSAWESSLYMSIMFLVSFISIDSSNLCVNFVVTFLFPNIFSPQTILILPPFYHPSLFLFFIN